MHGGYGVFLGLDVGKDGHPAVGLAPDGKRLHDAALPNTEAKLRALFDKLARHGTLLVVVDQPATIGALPVAVARVAGHQVAYLPGLAIRRIADLHPGSAKTDARDAYVIADTARTLPHTLRRVDAGDETFAFVRDAGRAFLEAYLPIVERRGRAGDDHNLLVLLRDCPTQLARRRTRSEDEHRLRQFLERLPEAVVVEPANWSEESRTSLAPHPPEPTNLVIELKAA